MTNVTKMLSVVALAGFLVIGTGAASVEAKTKCDNSVPPVCKQVKSSGTSPLYFFNELGIKTTSEAAAAAFRNPETREFIMNKWRIEVFYKGHEDRVIELRAIQAAKAEKAAARAEARAAEKAEKEAKAAARKSK